VIPYWLMTGLASITFGWAVLALAIGAWRYWRGTASGAGTRVSAPAAGQAALDILTLRNLGGGGHGCNDVDDSFAMQRRWFHQSMFYGFMLCFAATTTGAIYHHFLGWYSPHAFWSLPVQLGFWGGIGLCVGTAGLLWVKAVTDPAPVAKRLLGGEVAMLACCSASAPPACCCWACATPGRWACCWRCIWASCSASSWCCPIRRWCMAPIAGWRCCATRRSGAARLDAPSPASPSWCPQARRATPWKERSG
jgi:hypothetical protein